MKLNHDTAISTPSVLLVPYDRRHVPRYHEWMKDPAIQEATASEPMTLEEEYENQESWRESHDKLTFILCQPAAAAAAAASDAAAATDDDDHGDERAKTFVEAGEVDVPDKMIGDINFFIYPFDDDDEAEEEEEEEEEKKKKSGDAPTAEGASVIGEIDIMIANQGDRGRGLGKAAVSTFLYYIWSRRDAILNEYAQPQSSPSKDEGEEKGPSAAATTTATTTITTTAQRLRLKLLMAKIKATNERSIALFRSLGFVQEGEVNYFGEVKLVMRDLDSIARAPGGYDVVQYRRPVD